MRPGLVACVYGAAYLGMKKNDERPTAPSYSASNTGVTPTFAKAFAAQYCTSMASFQQYLVPGVVAKAFAAVPTVAVKQRLKASCSATSPALSRTSSGVDTKLAARVPKGSDEYQTATAEAAAYRTYDNKLVLIIHAYEAMPVTDAASAKAASSYVLSNWLTAMGAFATGAAVESSDGTSLRWRGGRLGARRCDVGQPELQAARDER